MAHANRTPTLLSALMASTLFVAACSTNASLDAAADSEAATEGELAAGTTASATTLAASADNQASHVDDEGDLDYDENDVAEITLDGTSASSDAAGVAIDGTTVTITEAGTYALSGTLDDGEIVVDAGDDDDVSLVLEGVDITNADGAAIAIMNADDALVVVAEGTTNRLTDGATYTFPDEETDEPNATLYSAADLAIAGSGELVVTANYNDGITSKDGLVIDEAAITVVAADDGIRGKDYVIVQGGAIVVESVGDGIKADNDEDEDRGYVSVLEGTLDIVAGDDGIQAATDILVTGGTMTIDAGVSSGTGRGLQGDVMVLIAGGDVTATAVDDAIHSNDLVAIEGGFLTLAAGDDGIHGDYLVTIDGGTITITDSFEGIEAEVIEVNDGVIDVTSNDDGLNVATAEATTTTTEPAAGEAAAPGQGGAPQGGGRGGGGPGGPADEAVGEHYVYINGGTISITVTGELAEQGDGIDANGHIVMTGGVVAISGATDTRNSALDYSGGTFTMSGGLLIGTNIDGRNSEGVGAGSTQASLYVTTGTTVAAGTVVEIASTDGESLVTFEPANDYSVIVFSSPDLVAGDSYEVRLGGESAGTATASL